MRLFKKQYLEQLRRKPGVEVSELASKKQGRPLLVILMGKFSSSFYL